MKIWKHEKKVAGLFVTHGGKVEKCLAEAKAAILSYLDGEPIEEQAARVNELESEADAVRREICTVLYQGAFLPLLREDLYELIATLDAVANEAESAVQFIHRQQPGIPDALRPGFRELAETSTESIRPLLEALDAYFKPKGKMKSIEEHVSRVLGSESEADEAEEALTIEIFRAAIPLEQKLHLRQLVRIMAQVSDRAEVAADRIAQVSLKTLV